MFNSYFFAKFALLALALSISPALTQTQPIFADSSIAVRTAKPEALRRQMAAQRMKTQMMRLRSARMRGEMLALTQQNDDLRRSVSASAADRKVAAVAIADLRTKLAHAEATAYSRYQGEVDAMTQRLQRYMTDSDAQLNTMKAGLDDVRAGLTQSQRQIRWAMARDIVKRRNNRTAQQVIAALRIELSKSQEALRLATAPASRSTSQNQTIAATAMPLAAPASTSGAPAIPPAAAQTNVKPAAPSGAPAVVADSEKQLAAEKPKPAKRKPVKQTESSGFSFFP